MKTRHLLTATAAISILAFSFGCSKDSPAELPLQDLAHSLQLHWWDIKIPDDIGSGKYLEVCFVDSEGNLVGSQRTSITVGPSSEAVRLIFRAVESDNEETLGETVGYVVNLIHADEKSSHKSRFAFKIVIPRMCNTSQPRNNGEVVNTGDLLMVFAPDSSSTTLSEVLDESQIGLITRIRDNQ